jgi:hypothetical protein
MNFKQKSNQVQWKQQFSLIKNQVSQKKEIQNSSYFVFGLQILHLRKNIIFFNKCIILIKNPLQKKLGKLQILLNK